MTPNIENTIINEIALKGTVSTKELTNLFRVYPEYANEGTIGWRIHEMKRKGIIHQVERGWYSLPNNKKTFSPDISNRGKALFADMQKYFPGIKLCLTETGWFNEWMTHQVFVSYIILEVEKVVANTVFRELQEFNDFVYYNPDRKTMDLLVKHDKMNIIVKPLISESPLQAYSDIVISSLEKMMVDLVSDDIIFSAQSEEAPDIFNNITSKYPINLPKLLRYARRRKREKVVQNLLNDHKGNLPPGMAPNNSRTP